MNGLVPRTRWRCVLWVGLLFLAYSFWTAAIPGSNESHYLCKAKFWWQPDWCSRDLFLESSNPHLVFYVAFGWMAKWLSLEAVTVISRITGYFALAAGWEWLCRGLRLSQRATVLAACLLMFCAATVTLSGEWLLGGIESKVFAYAGAFAAIGATCERRFIAAGAMLGIAIAFHPLVGVWSVVALTFAALGIVATQPSVLSDLRSPLAPLGREAGGERQQQSSLQPRDDSASQSPAQTRRRLIAEVSIAINVMLLIAAAGLVPALSSISATDPQAATNATFIQVFYRLRHHLHPAAFPVGNYVAYGVLLLLSWWLARKLIATPALRLVKWFVLGAVLIAACGWVIGISLTPEQFSRPLFGLRMTALKFYPFRLVDAVVPAVFSILLAQWLDELAEFQPRAWWVRRSGLLASMLVLFSLEYGRGAGAARYLPNEREGDWLAVCRWVRGHTPENALFVTPNESWAFKWFAERAEYVAFKDCPQDAASLNEWNNRLRWLASWAERGFIDTTYSRDEIEALIQKTQATHFITRRPAVLEAREIFANDSYIVYELADSKPAASQ